MTTKNSYSVKKLNKDLAKLKQETAVIVNRAVKTTLEGTTSENAFVMSFDQVEAIPFGVDNTGKVVFTASTDDPVELDEQLAVVAAKLLDALENEIKTSMKGVL